MHENVKIEVHKRGELETEIVGGGIRFHLTILYSMNTKFANSLSHLKAKN